MKILKNLKPLLLVLLILLLSYGKSICQSTSLTNNIWYKPTIEIVNGDTIVAIKVPAFIVFTREFIKGENAKKREPLLMNIIKSDSVYIRQLSNTNELAAKEIVNQITQKDSTIKQSKIEIDKINKKADRRVKNRTIVMSFGWIVGVIGSFIIGTKI